MLPYLITAAPNRRQRLMRAVRHYTVRGLITAGLLLLASAVFTARCGRVLMNLAATLLAEWEFAAARKAGTPPLGASLGASLAAAFTAEFRRASSEAA